MRDKPAHGHIEDKILTIRDRKVMLDRDLAELYGIQTKRLNEQVKRNIERFPDDFMFGLTDNELEDLKSQSATSSWGGTRKPPNAFTEHGILMLSNVINSERAVRVSIQIIRVFNGMKKMIAANRDIFDRLEEMKKELGRLDRLESRQDTESRAIWNAIRILQKKLIG